jgi:hypothetical protein
MAIAGGLSQLFTAALLLSLGEACTTLAQGESVGATEAAGAVGGAADSLSVNAFAFPQADIVTAAKQMIKLNNKIERTLAILNNIHLFNKLFIKPLTSEIITQHNLNFILTNNSNGMTRLSLLLFINNRFLCR